MNTQTNAKQHISKLPEYCYSLNNVNGDIIKICSGMSGYYPQQQFAYIKRLCESKTNAEVVNDLNNSLGVTLIQREAMEIGSMFGWEVPGANPDNYDLVVIPK